MSDREATYPVDFVDPRLADPWICGIVGNIGSGKTVLVERLMCIWKFVFDVIVIFSPTYALQPHKEIKDARGIIIFDQFSVENLAVVKEHQEKRNARLVAEGKKPSRMLLILDDQGAGTRKLLQGGALDEIMIKTRHYKINVIQLAQRYMQLSPTLRSNAKYLILFAECNPQERRNLYTYHGCGKRKLFLDTIDKYTYEQFSWIGLQCLHCRPATNYRFFTASDGYLQ